MSFWSSLFISAIDSWYRKGDSKGQNVKWSQGTSFKTTTDVKEIKQPTPPQTDDKVRLIPYGTVIPRISGTQIVSTRQPFWKGELEAVPYQDERGNTKYNYYMDLAYILCSGEIQGVYRCWQDGELRSEYGTSQNKLPGTLYTGTETQNPDSTIQAAEGAINTPAFRGISYIVMERFWLGESVKLPTFKFEIVKGEAF